MKPKTICPKCKIIISKNKLHKHNSRNRCEAQHQRKQIETRKL